jgi:hypothetical protein
LAFETLSGARNLTVPRAPLMIVPPMSLVGVFKETAKTSRWPTRARA